MGVDNSAISSSENQQTDFNTPIEGNEEGQKISQEQPPEKKDHVFLEGEIDLQTTVTVVSKKQAAQQAVSRKEEAIEQAKAGNCKTSWATWKNATRHLLRNIKWRESNEQAVKTSIAECYVEKARSSESRVDKITHLIDARFWDHQLESMLEMALPLAEELDKEGQLDTAEAKKFSAQKFLDAQFALASVSKDPKKVFKRSKKKLATSKEATSLWEAAYEKFSLAMQLAPHRSWTRNRAEEARDHKLYIKRPYQVDSKRTNKLHRDLLKLTRVRNKSKRKEKEKSQK